MTIALDQERHIPPLAADYGFLDRKSALASLVVHTNLNKSLNPAQVAIPFRQLVGSLLWIARHTHPEVMQLVAYLAQFCPCYARDRTLGALRVLKHLNTVKYRKLTFKGDLRYRTLSFSSMTSQQEHPVKDLTRLVSHDTRAGVNT